MSHTTAQIIDAARTGITQARKVLGGVGFDAQQKKAEIEFTGIGFAGSFVIQNYEALSLDEVRKVSYAFAADHVPFTGALYKLGDAKIQWVRQHRQVRKGQ